MTPLLAGQDAARINRGENLVGPAFVPAICHMRTDAERQDQRLSWARSDEAFFASGACHILAYQFMQKHVDDRYRVILVRPSDGLPGSHVYVTDGSWACDFNGWTPESTVLAATTAECRRRWPSWDGQRVRIDGDLDGFCRRWSHRRPADFAFDVIDRAERFLDRFPQHPPDNLPFS